MALTRTPSTRRADLVTMLMTPNIAPVPYTTDPGPRTTSMRSMSSMSTRPSVPMYEDQM